MTLDSRADPFEVWVSMDPSASSRTIGDGTHLSVGDESVLSTKQVKDLVG